MASLLNVLLVSCDLISRAFQFVAFFGQLLCTIRRDLLNFVLLHRSLLMFRGRCRGSSAGLGEFTSQGPGIEACDLRSKDVVTPTNIDGLQEFFLPKSPDRHWG